MTNYVRAVYYLYNMMKHAYWSREELAKYQDKRLRRIVKHAYDSVPFYHKRFREMGIKPDDVRTVRDLNKIPIVRKDEVKKNPSDVVSEEFNIANLKKLNTSGSTGELLNVYLTRAEDEYRKAKHLRANISCGQKPRDRWVTITRHLKGESSKLQRSLGFYASIPISVFYDVETQLSIMEKLKPSILDGYSNSLLLLAKEMENAGIETIKPKFVMGGAELIAPSSRQFIEKAFDAPFYDQYAIVEFERLAWQCPEKNGYHIDADSVIMQFADENGEVVAPGENGEIICTSLFNYAMPFIRYEVGDIGVESEETYCSCGRTLPLMKLLEGRKGSILRLPDGRVLAPFAFIAALMSFKFSNSIDLFRVIQRKTNLLSFKVKKKDRSVDETTMERELLAHLEKVLNIGTSALKIEVDFVDDIPLDKNGKFMIVVSEL